MMKYAKICMNSIQLAKPTSTRILVIKLSDEIIFQ